jgi:hypothetical protein
VSLGRLSRNTNQFDFINLESSCLTIGKVLRDFFLYFVIKEHNFKTLSLLERDTNNDVLSTPTVRNLQK